MGNPILLIDQDGKAPKIFDPPKLVFFVQVEYRTGFFATQSQAIGFFADTYDNIGIFTTDTYGVGLIVGGGAGFSWGVANTEIEKFNGEGWTAGGFIDVIVNAGGAELNAYPSDLRDNISPGNSFYETFIKNTDFGITVSPPGLGIGLGAGYYIEYGKTQIHYAENITGGINNLLEFLESQGKQLTPENKADNINLVQNGYAEIQNAIDCEEECVEN